MPTLYPPDYPLRPDAPLLSYGPAFAAEIARSIMLTLCRPPESTAHEDETRGAAALTMLEAFHPRDHLECMMAAQGVAAHGMIMECHRRAMHPGTAEAVAIKIRGNITQMSRTFSMLTHDLERRHAKPQPPRPPEAPAPVAPPPPPVKRPRSSPPASPETRPDGTPASLTAYAPPAPPEEPYIPPEPEIMMALATRPKPWRMVNAPAADAEAVVPSVPAAPAPAKGGVANGGVANGGPANGGPANGGMVRGGVDLRERLFTGDALARFTSARFDPDAPVAPSFLDEEGAMVELELISTGGDPEMEAERAALAAAHPEGKSAVILRYGRPKPGTAGET